MLLSQSIVRACCLAVACGTPGTADPAPKLDIRSEDGKVLIAADQVRSYDWATHTLTLVPKVRDELGAQLLKTKRLAAGVPFAVAVGGKTIYTGTFTTIEVSRSFSTPVILVGPVLEGARVGKDQLHIQLGYPTVEFFKGQDPRGDRRIRQALQDSGQLAEADSSHAEWIGQAMRAIAAIKPGMTRADLLRVFEEEGGLSNRLQRRFVYRGSLHIKVDVTFEAVGAPDDKLTERPQDKIKSISGPFLQWSISD